jgi:hypothetical protein
MNSPLFAFPAVLIPGGTLFDTKLHSMDVHAHRGQTNGIINTLLKQILSKCSCTLTLLTLHPEIIIAIFITVTVTSTSSSSLGGLIHQEKKVNPH